MEIVADSRRGHIALVRGSETVVSFADLGPVLHVWQYGNGVELDPAAAQRLGDALTSWARRKMSDQECRYPCGCDQLPEDRCACMDGHPLPQGEAG